MSRAMVFAAGLGKRLRPITETLPKPLVKVGGQTMLDRALDLLAGGGVHEAVVNASYLKEQIVAHVAARIGAPRITLSLEDTPLETGGGVMQAWEYLSHAPFFAMNSDVVLLPGNMHPVTQLKQAWDADANLDAVLLVIPYERAIGYDGAGDFFLDAAGTPRFRRADEKSAPYVFTGLQMLHPRLFADHPPVPFSLNVLYRRLCDAAQTGEAPRIRALVHDGDWLHVGDADGLQKAERYFA